MKAKGKMNETGFRTGAVNRCTFKLPEDSPFPGALARRGRQVFYHYEYTN